MIIREAQIQAFEIAAKRQFEQRTVDQLKVAAPRHCQILGDDGAREAVRFAITRSATYGIVTERGVCTYVDLMFMLCRFFDKDPLFPWAAEILQRKQDRESDRVRALYEQGAHYVNAVTGASNEHALAAIERIRGTNWVALESPSGGDLFENQLRLWTGLFPEKVRYAGPTLMRNLISGGISLATGYGFKSETSQRIYTTLMFLLGAHFDEDPLHVWAAVAIRSGRNQAEPERARRLYEAGLKAVGLWVN